ncbi:extracellular solute-binding protein [Candidatus Poribacteria bacterium]|nr:extracellular solute-binding protein [Candidatus Poribacteria bacterium]MYH81760.1 extracellular solute-binding protein [Candidatus Poribacteria bacterium]MYK95989.1 extracellular solute-binding protein [Candidatus Poribacteria bacterium]
MSYFKPLALAIISCFLALPLLSLAQDELIIISPHPEGIETEFGKNFEKWYEVQTGRTVKTDWRDVGGTSSNYRFIESEFKRVPEGIGIDIFFGGGTDNYLRLSNMGWLHAYPLPGTQLEQMMQSFQGIPLYDAEYQWYGAALSSFGIMYNEELRELLKLPKATAWEDLGNLELLGRIGAADPRESGSAHMVYEIILQTIGWEDGFALLTKLGGNVRGFSAGANAIPTDVVAGQVIYGLAIDFYAYGQIAIVGADKIKYVVPADGAVVTADPIAILKGAPNLPVAEKFLEFVLSEDAQKLWMLRDTDPEGPKWKGGLNRASVLPALYDKLGERCIVPNPFAMEGTPFQYDSDKGSIRWEVVNELFGVLIINSHKDLVNAWKAIQKCKDPAKRDAAIAILTKMPITEAEAMELAKDAWNDPTVRNEKIKEWGLFAKEKFKEARNLAR